MKEITTRIILVELMLWTFMVFCLLENQLEYTIALGFILAVLIWPSKEEFNRLWSGIKSIKNFFNKFKRKTPSKYYILPEKTLGAYAIEDAIITKRVYDECKDLFADWKKQ